MRLTVRLVEIGDFSWLFELARDRRVIDASFHREPPGILRHTRWFIGQYLSGDTLVVEDCGEPVGRATFKYRAEGEVEIGVAIRAKHRGLGYGGPVIRAATEMREPGETVYARIKYGNVPSLVAFRRAGFDFADRPSWVDPKEHISILKRVIEE